MFTYAVDRSLLPKELAETFHGSSLDPDAEQFIKECERAPRSELRLFLASILSIALPAYEVHGLLGIYPMHLLSEKQWSDLVGIGDGRTLLDVGAGQGFVTAKARNLFSKIVTTETSHSMAKVLRKQGFECFEEDLGKEMLPGDKHFDVISLLNVLDRCERPLSLLKNCISMLAPGGKLLIATPLPIHAYVRNILFDAEPVESLQKGEAASWEASLVDLYQQVIQKHGLRVVRWTRLPYMWQNEGPAHVESLDDSVLVCQRV